MNIAVKNPSIVRPAAGLPVFVAFGLAGLSLRAGASVGDDDFPDETPVVLPELAPGTDYAVEIADGRPVARPCVDGLPVNAIGGFHYAPGGNAVARGGGDSIPAINPCSIWDAGFRPACPDPCGMALVDGPAGRFWADIYMLGIDHLGHGTSRFGVTIADGRSLPQALDGKGRTKKLDYATAAAIYAHHGKQIMTYDEFRAAAFGVTEKSAADDDPATTGLDAARTSRFGLMQATGNLWVWGADGDPDDPRPSIFGGSWVGGVYSGSRYAVLGCWPARSGGGLSARGRSDHLNPA